MRFPQRRAGAPADVLARADLPRGEKVLALAATDDGSWLLGTRRFLVVLPANASGQATDRIPWERVEDATWDQEESRLRVTEIGEYGAARPVHDLVMEEPALLLQLVRERVTASIVIQRRVAVRGRLGLTVIGRRSPAGGPVAWMHAYDTGLDPADAEVAAAAAAALAGARAEVGEDTTNPI